MFSVVVSSVLLLEVCLVAVTVENFTDNKSSQSLHAPDQGHTTQTGTEKIFQEGLREFRLDKQNEVVFYFDAAVNV